MAVNSKVSM